MMIPKKSYAQNFLDDGFKEAYINKILYQWHCWSITIYYYSSLLEMLELQYVELAILALNPSTKKNYAFIDHRITIINEHNIAAIIWTINFW